MKVLIELDELNNIRSAALDNDDRIEKIISALVYEMREQLAEKDACIARLKDKLALHESSLQFTDGLVKEQVERIRKMMARESLEAAKLDSDGWRKVGGECPFDHNPLLIVRFGNGSTVSGYANEFNWKNDIGIVECRLHPSVTKPDSEGWLSWSGGECPVNGDVDVILKFKNGDTYSTKALWLNYWDRDIVAYRIVEPVAKLDSDGWIAWAGGESPVDCDVEVEVKYGSGKISDGVSDIYRWEHRGNPLDIVAYRIVK